MNSISRGVAGKRKHSPEDAKPRVQLLPLSVGTYFRDISTAVVSVSVNVKKCLDDWRVIQENTKVWELEGNVEGFDSWYIIHRLRRNSINLEDRTYFIFGRK
jgi:hypothetical protein